MLSVIRDARTVAKDWLESRHWPARPQSINFEITAACDARCIHCPRLDMDRPMKPMPMELFRRMIDQAAELRVSELCPNGYGEICTMPMRMVEPYFRHMRAAPWRFKIIINTNGYRMNEDRARLFIEHGVHLVNVTIDGATAATAEAIRVGLEFDRIEANVKNLLNMRNAAGKRYPKVRVGMVAMPQTLPEAGQFLNRWRGTADFVGLGGFSSRASSVSIASAGELAPNRPATACVLPFRDLNVWADGKAVLCCEDWNEEFVVGDLNTETIAEVWHGSRMTAAREQHLAHNGHRVALCARCDHWKPAGPGAHLWSSSDSRPV
jgi:hypothetical protein